MIVKRNVNRFSIASAAILLVVILIAVDSKINKVHLLSGSFQAYCSESGNTLNARISPSEEEYLIWYGKGIGPTMVRTTDDNVIEVYAARRSRKAPVVRMTIRSDQYEPTQVHLNGISGGLLQRSDHVTRVELRRIQIEGDG